MKSIAQAFLVGTALCMMAGPGFAQDKPKAEVMHWWTSGGESAAIKTFAKAYEKAGGEWVDSATAGGENARAAAINRMVGGNPPAAAQFNTGKQFDDLVSQGLIRPIEDLAEQGGWKDKMPPALVSAASRDGKLYALPVNVHGQNWTFYSKDVLEKAGISELPDNWDDLIPALEKIKQAGFTPLALGGQPWQEHVLFNSILLSVGGKDLYMKVYRDKDEDAVRSDGFRKAVETFGRLRGLVDAGSPGRNWNDATNLLITDKAGIQVMGDWAKGEFTSAGEKAGQDYGCTIGLDDSMLMVGGDVFVFPKVDDPEKRKAQDLLANTMMDPEAQVAFNLAKGSMPIRNDVDTNAFDACAKKGLKLLKEKDRQVPVFDILVSASLVGSVDDVLTQFWNNPDAPADNVVAGFVNAFELEG
ncbi:ABC transporter substrate-binding protein [Aurantimonas sp. VKM B-3413]|uniref:ABC transporter substrate-binding protein n=1 Tax=Aurantimonas sp. VKM B-3413 TaxID=2779401 RepID=UPI001E4A0C12|nr:ABC transporter substrate-binding protein [Aurantimonas sp. VKM B-3413]MCB8840426.1 ABC transporter substrate-binding protein [Aurantimonas sp. VKM B-3413]